MFSHKYTEKQLNKLEDSDTASWLTLDYYTLYQHADKLLRFLQEGSFPLRSSHTAGQDTKLLNLIFQS